MMLRLKQDGPVTAKIVRKDNPSRYDVIMGIKSLYKKMVYDNMRECWYAQIVVETEDFTYKYDSDLWNEYVIRDGL